MMPLTTMGVISWYSSLGFCRWMVLPARLKRYYQACFILSTFAV